MTTDAEKLAVMEGAIKHGKPLEGRQLPNGAWCRHFYPSWNWAAYDYRLARERKKVKVWVNVYPEGSASYSGAYSTAQAARNAATQYAVAIAVPVEFEYEEGHGLEGRQ